MILTEDEVLKQGFTIDKANKKNIKNPRYEAVKGDVILLTCGSCSKREGKKIYKSLDLFYKNKRAKYNKSHFCGFCLNSLDRTYKKSVNPISNFEEESIRQSKQVNCQIRESNKGFEIWYHIGNTFDWKKAINKTYDYYQQAHSQITEQLTSNLIKGI